MTKSQCAYLRSTEIKSDSALSFQFTVTLHSLLAVADEKMRMIITIIPCREGIVSSVCVASAAETAAQHTM